MDSSKDQPKLTAGLDIGDKYSYLCLIDQQSGEIMEEGRLRTTPEALRRRFSSELQPLRVAIEAGTHSPWVSRVLEECGHEVLVANPRKVRLIYTNKRKTDEIDAENLARLARVDPKLLYPLKHRGEDSPRLTWRSSAHVRHWSGAARSWSITSLRSGQVFRCSPSQVLGQELSQEGRRAHPCGTLGSHRAHLGADRLADRAHPRLRPKAGGDL